MVVVAAAVVVVVVVAVVTKIEIFISKSGFVALLFSKLVDGYKYPKWERG